MTLRSTRMLIVGGCACLLLALIGGVLLMSGPSARAAGVALHTKALLGTKRFTPNSLAKAKGKARLVLTSARNAREGAQLAVTAARTARVTVRATQLHGPHNRHISSSNISLYLEQTLAVHNPSPGEPAVGSVYDPLLPLNGRAIRISARSTALFWVDVHTNPGLPPGMYRGSIELSGPNVRTKRVPMRLHVYRVTLPKRPALASSVGIDGGQIARLEHVSMGSDAYHQLLTKYDALLAQHQLSPADLDVDDAVGSSRFAAAQQRTLAATLDRSGVASARIPFYATWPFADPLGRDRSQALDYLRRVAAYFQQHGWLTRSYVYAIDEPKPSQFAAVRSLHRLVHQANAKLRLLVTTEPQRALEGSVDIWAANISARFHARDVTRAHKLHTQYWWYPSISSVSPYPTLFVDDTRSSAQALGWLAFHYKVNGLLYWESNHWQQVANPWTQSVTYTQGGAVGNGDGSLVYPGAEQGLNGPAPSVRLMQLGQGIEDYDVLRIATHRGHATARAVARLAAHATPNIKSANGWPRLAGAHNSALRLAAR